MKDTQLKATADGRLKVGDLVTITVDYAHLLRARVYDNRKTVDELRAERTGPIAEIWIGGSDAHPWCSIRVECEAPHPWQAPDELEHVVPAERSAWCGPCGAPREVDEHGCVACRERAS